MEVLELNKDESEPIKIPMSDNVELKIIGERSLLGNIFTKWKIRGEVIRATMEKIWKVSKPLAFRDLGSNCFVISSRNQRDKERVLRGSLWLFDNYLFALMSYVGKAQIQLVEFFG